MRGMMGGFYKISEWIMRLAVINVLWLLCSVPFWLVGLTGFMNMNAATDEAQITGLLQTTVILMAILSPFTFFPATSAMFSVARKWVMGDTDVPLLKTFFRNYKQNYKQAMIGGILYSLISTILIIDYRVYLTRIENLQIVAYLFIALMLLVVVSLHHFFSLLSHFHMKTTQLLKNALVLTIGRPIRSVIMTLGTVAILFISTRFTFLIPFFFGSVIATFTFYNFNLIITKMMAGNEALTEEQNGSLEEDQETKS
ncbi:YesL family protein [Cohnella candidum]|nr:DUF624 domain-containing protein [Cohnella candidum]